MCGQECQRTCAEDPMPPSRVTALPNHGKLPSWEFWLLCSVLQFCPAIRTEAWTKRENRKKKILEDSSPPSFWPLELSFSIPWARTRSSFLDLSYLLCVVTSGLRFCFVHAGVTREKVTVPSSVLGCTWVLVTPHPPNHTHSSEFPVAPASYQAF